MAGLVLAGDVRRMFWRVPERLVHLWALRVLGLSWGKLQWPKALAMAVARRVVALCPVSRRGLVSRIGVVLRIHETLYLADLAEFGNPVATLRQASRIR